MGGLPMMNPMMMGAMNSMKNNQNSGPGGDKK